MIHIIAGSINSGKTTKLLSLYNEIKSGDGFILSKVFIDNNYAGQQIIRLSTGVSLPFSFKRDYIPAYWDEKYIFDVYSFSHEGFKFAYETVKDIVSNNISPLFIDEIGPLELEEKVLFQLLSQLVSRDYNMYISVREFLLEDVLVKFKIKQYEIISV
jgi:nucleoside-triphosphatase THEP1